MMVTSQQASNQASKQEDRFYHLPHMVGLTMAHPNNNLKHRKHLRGPEPCLAQH